MIGYVLAGVMLAAGGAVANDETGSDQIDDPFLWLEEVESEKALDWAREQNERSLGVLKALPTYQPMYERNLAVYDSDERIAYPGQRGGHVFNFWRDAEHERGLWRRAKTEDYIAANGEPQWETLLDLDALAEAEDENWVWKGSDCARPDYNRCLLRLSRGGADAVVVREYDIAEGKFITDGFNLPEAKSGVSWMDSDTVFVSTDFGPDSMTDSGYPRIAKCWKRGQPLSEAVTIFAGEKSDVWNSAYRIHDGDDHYDLVSQVPSFFTSRQFLIGDDGELKRLEFPEDADLQGVFKGQLLVELKSEWEVGGKTYPQGALISIGMADFLAGKRDFQQVVSPKETSAIGSISTTKDFLVVNHLDNVSNRLERFTMADGKWKSQAIETRELGSISLVSSDDSTDDFFYVYEGFLTPDTLYVARDGGTKSAVIDQLPAFFDAEGMVVTQHFSTSRDGTKIPYFQIAPPEFEADGTTPTLLYGYGGFEVSMRPGYSATIGESWVERGGVYVVANIRGGGEYGPRWHQAALKENRQLAYDDFISVAEDLIARNITRPEHLGIRGGSNGGLLTGVMLTQRPDLFGGVVIQVPLLDMRRFNQLLAGASWMAEYGDPDTDDWEFIKEYSPYQNLEAGKEYTRAFITTSTRDDRVHPGHARKFVAKMQDLGYEPLYYENIEGGHGGAANNRQQAEVQALIYSYLWDQLTVE